MNPMTDISLQNIEAELIKCTSDVAGASVIAAPRTPHHAPLTTHQ